MSETSINKVLFSGRIEDVVVRQTQRAGAVTNFTLVLTDRFKDDKPVRQFIKTVAWRGLGQRVAEMPVGAKVRVSGRLETASWKDKQTGAWKHRLQIVADTCEAVAHLQQPPDQAGIDRRPISDEDVGF